MSENDSIEGTSAPGLKDVLGRDVSADEFNLANRYSLSTSRELKRLLKNQLHKDCTRDTCVHDRHIETRVASIVTELAIKLGEGFGYLRYFGVSEEGMDAMLQICMNGLVAGESHGLKNITEAYSRVATEVVGDPLEEPKKTLTSAEEEKAQAEKRMKELGAQTKLHTQENDMTTENGEETMMLFFSCTTWDLDYFRQMSLEQEAEFDEETRLLDAESSPVCHCDRSDWVGCPELETAPECHCEDTCPYSCFEGTIPCPYCEGEPNPPTVYDPRMDRLPHHLDWWEGEDV